MVGFALLAMIVLIALLTRSHSGASASSSRSRVAAHRVARAPRRRPRKRPQRGGGVGARLHAIRESRGHARAREVALTFDDGPGPYTPEVLSVLERYHVQATFFVIGRMLEYFSASTVREMRDGDAIGDHTQTHPMLARLSAHEQHEELFEQIARVELLGGKRPVLFRPPYGSFNAVTLAQLRQLHLLMVLWSVDTGDYLQPGVEAIVQHALAGAQPGAIILMHDGGGEPQRDDRRPAGDHQGPARARATAGDGPPADARRPAARRTAAAAEPERRLDGRRRLAGRGGRSAAGRSGAGGASRSA